MSTKLFRSVIAIAVFGGLWASAAAADNGWKLPNLNPFSSKGKPPTSGRAAKPSGNGWHFPNLLPKASPKRAGNQPSTWQKMTSGTKSLMSKTSSALNPWDDNKPAEQTASKAVPAVSGSNSLFSQATSKKQTSPPQESGSGSVLPANWFSAEKKETDQQPRSVNDFLARPRPQ